VHLVRLSGRSEARRPRLDEVREQVVEALLRQRRQQANDAAYAQLRDRYEIVIELPEVARAAWQP
jgi:parvulin-like peptidyl-prolyl isomerase